MQLQPNLSTTRQIWPAAWSRINEKLTVSQLVHESPSITELINFIAMSTERH